MTCNQTLWSLPFRPWLLERWIALFTGYWSLSVTRCSKKPILCYPFDRDLSSECHYQPFEQPGIGTWTHEKLFAHNNVNNLIFPGKAALTYNLTCCTFLMKMWMLCLFLAKFPFSIDENECEAGTHSCDANAQCSNTIGSFTCACLQGYAGNGLSCSGELTC